MPSRAGSPGYTPDGAPKGRGQGGRLGWGGGYDRPQPAGCFSQVVTLPPGTEAGTGGGGRWSGHGGRPWRQEEAAGRSGQRAGWVGVCSIAQSCLALGDPVDCSLPGYSAHFLGKDTGVVAIVSSKRSSQPLNLTGISCVSCTGRRTTELAGSPTDPVSHLLSSIHGSVSHMTKETQSGQATCPRLYCLSLAAPREPRAAWVPNPCL